MRKILYYFLSFVVTSITCLAVGYGIIGYNMRQEQAVSNTATETKTVNDMDDKTAMNQGEIKPILESTPPTREHYLVSEPGFPLVFCSDRSTICLYIHIPATDFPEMKQAKPMEGMWSPSMMDVYHYLESYTSQDVLEYIF